MSPTAPLRIPVEIRRRGSGPRWFRLARGISEHGLLFVRPLPEDCEGPLALVFHLPEDPAPLSLDGQAIAVDTSERDDGAPVERLAIRFVAPDEASRTRIARYVAERVPA